MRASLVPAFLLAAFVLAASPPSAQADTRGVTVIGVGTAAARPDTATVTTGVVSEAASAREAMDLNSAAMTETVAALKAEGIAPADIQTVNVSVQPRYQHDRDGSAPRIVGYRAANSVQVAVRDLDALGRILDRLVTAGTNEIGGIAFTIDDTSALEDEARKAAMADARRKAEVYAEAAGGRLGRILGIAEESAQAPPRPMLARQALEVRDAGVPIEAGEHTVRVEIRAQWRLID